MRRLAIIGALSACLLGGVPFEAAADEQTEKALEERIRRLEKLVEELIKHEAKGAKEEGKEKAPAYTFGSTGGGKSIYAKHFVSSPKATVGGDIGPPNPPVKNSKFPRVGKTRARAGRRHPAHQPVLSCFYPTGTPPLT